MTIRTIFLAGLLTGFTTIALGQSGTPEEQAACRPDVRRFCYHLKEAAGSNAFLQCLQAHRSRLSKPCLAVIDKNGG